jgi:hypothetical protein
MTDSNNSNQEIYALLAELARRQIQTENNLQRTQEKINYTQEQNPTGSKLRGASRREVCLFINNLPLPGLIK